MDLVALELLLLGWEMGHYQVSLDLTDRITDSGWLLYMTGVLLVCFLNWVRYYQAVVYERKMEEFDRARTLAERKRAEKAIARLKEERRAEDDHQPS